MITYTYNRVPCEELVLNSFCLTIIKIKIIIIIITILIVVHLTAHMTVILWFHIFNISKVLQLVQRPDTVWNVRISNLCGVRISFTVQTSPKPDLAACTFGKGALTSRVKRPGHGSDIISRVAHRLKMCIAVFISINYASHRLLWRDSYSSCTTV
jgi:hypothetical protein